MKKIIVIGCPGSGKSTFSKKLHQITQIPLYHLDMLYWKPDKTTVDKSEFSKRVSEILPQRHWIIDGNYISTMEARMKACDTVVFLDFQADVCLSGIEERKGKARSDIPWIESDDFDVDFINFIKNFAFDTRPQILDLLDKYHDKNVYILKSRNQADAFLLKCEFKA